MAATNDRRRRWTAPLLLSAGYALLLAAWIFGNPPFAAPDEAGHYLRAIGIGNGQPIGEPGATTATPAGPRSSSRSHARPPARCPSPPGWRLTTSAATPFSPSCPRAASATFRPRRPVCSGRPTSARICRSRIYCRPRRFGPETVPPRPTASDAWRARRWFSLCWWPRYSRSGRATRVPSRCSDSWRPLPRWWSSWARWSTAAAWRSSRASPSPRPSCASHP